MKGSFLISTLLAETKRWRNPTIFPFSNALAQEIVEDLEAVLEQFIESPGILLPVCLQRKNNR